MKSIMPLFLIVLSIALFYVFIQPHYTEVQRLTVQASEYRTALDKVDELRSVRDKLITEFNALPKEEVDRLNRLVPDSLNIVKLVTDIDSVAGKYGITIKSIQVAEEAVDQVQGLEDVANSKKYLTTSITFRFVATYANLVNYLKDLEKSLQVVDITGVIFDSGKETNGTYDYSVTMQTYRLK